ncbi:hypothetical protein [Lentzea sp. CA-135723]|uniref:hypothetical protein n=1 Tax=Lentzea sp. CA-135723 TaxID=3239950 RepID=UPI003D8D2788
MRYLEPGTDGPAKDDWSTGLILEEMRGGSLALGVVAVLTAAGAVACWLLPSSPGTVSAGVVLALVALLGGLGTLVSWVETRSERSGLLDGPWRRVPVELLDAPGGTGWLRADGLVLKGWFEDYASVLLERGEAFLCGPDADGRAVLRFAGFARMEHVKVDRSGKSAAFPVRPREERPLGRPLDHPATARAFKGLRRGARAWLLAVVPAGVGALVILLSFFPLAPAGLVVGGLVLVPALLAVPALLEISRWHRDAVLAVEGSARWTPVPTTLLPWEAGDHVAGLAEMPGGLALVQFVLPELSVIANIADTGVMWIAGTHDDVIAVGVPRVPVLTFAAVQPDRDTPKEDPIPWIQRFTQPDFSGLPR